MIACLSNQKLVLGKYLDSVPSIIREQSRSYERVDQTRPARRYSLAGLVPHWTRLSELCGLVRSRSIFQSHIVDRVSLSQDQTERSSEGTFSVFQIHRQHFRCDSPPSLSVCSRVFLFHLGHEQVPYHVSRRDRYTFTCHVNVSVGLERHQETQS
jgi:hypothetical protein